MRRIFRWARYGFVVAAVLAVAGILLFDTIVKEIVQHRLQSRTGMEVRIGKLDLGLGSSTVSIENLKVRNAAAFGGGPFLDVPEFYLEYDRGALRERKLRVKMLRVNLAEIDIVQDADGRMNIQGLAQAGRAAAGVVARHSSDFTFEGIDTLNVTLGRMRILHPGAPGQTQEVEFGLTNQIFHDIRAESDWEGIEVLLSARSAAASPTGNAPVDVRKLLKQLSSGR